MRKKIVAGNWKMNKGFEEALSLLEEIKSLLEEEPIKEVELVICPPSIYLELTADLGFESTYYTGAQNVSRYENGAYTGEISAEMLDELDVAFCIIGHSERRNYFHESNEDIAKKAERLLQCEISPIFCCGELLEERESNRHFDVVKQQVKESLFSLSEKDIQEVIIAYEPVWAIGTGKTATADQAQEMHAFIRSLLTEQYGNEIASSISILYGGSCNPTNAKELFSNEDIDGGLIGGASLKAQDFLSIAKSF